jgi:Ser/Thr protein kinase RdoA (MazF antagonist)
VGCMEHGYTNATSGDRAVITKSYRGPDADRRCALEAAVLAALADQLPVPPLVGHAGTTVKVGRLHGVHGQELVDAGLADSVLRACGAMLRRIHAVDPPEVLRGSGAGAGAVLVHGDFGPQNVLLDPQAREVTAVLDWEWAHAGNPVEDLAWCEWIIRTHHPAVNSALSSFFAAYGREPSWSDRHQAMLAQCRMLLAFCERWQPDGASVQVWRQRISVTESWAE